MEEGHRLGWGPWGPWPLSAWRYIFYTPRPDLHRSKTRAKEWKLLKSPWRYFHALFFYFGPPSHILYNIKYPYLLVQIISLLVQVVGGYTSAIPWKDEMTSIKTAFTMSSFTMSLLLSFRINQVYTRWKEARQSISGVGNGATNIFMTLFIWLQDQPDKQQLLEDLRRYCIVWPYSVLQVVRGDPALDPIATSLLSHAEMSVYSGSRKGRQVVATAVRNLVREANLPMEQFISVETLIQATIKSSGDALRIKFQAMPQGVTLICTGFVWIWCLLLPFGMSNYLPDIDWPCIFGTAVISLLLLSTDEVASQLEDPFPSLPLQDIVNTYERDINRIHKETRDISLAISEGRKTGGHALAAPPEVRLTTWLHDGGDAKEKEALLMRNGV